METRVQEKKGKGNIKFDVYREHIRKRDVEVAKNFQ